MQILLLTTYCHLGITSIEAEILHAGKAESLILQAVPMDKSLILNILSPTAKTEALAIAIDMSQVAKEESAGEAQLMSQSSLLQH